MLQFRIKYSHCDIISFGWAVLFPLCYTHTRTSYLSKGEKRYKIIITLVRKRGKVRNTDTSKHSNNNYIAWLRCQTNLKERAEELFN